jgi:hypothetical protein
MKMLQRGVLYSLILSSLNLFAMEFVARQQLDVDTCIENVRDQIDENILGITKDSCGRSLQVMFLSWYKNRWLTDTQAMQEMKRIESYIPSNMSDSHRRRVFYTLVTQHWYVDYLDKALMRDKINDLGSVTGLTIDTMNNNTDDSIAQERAHNLARSQFFNALMSKKLTDIMPRVLDDIHFTILYGDNDIQPNSLVMSADSQYLRATDCTGTHMTWELKTGDKVNPEKIDLVTQWVRGRMYCDDYKNSLFGLYDHTFEEQYRVVDKNDNYCAMVTHPDMAINGEFFPKEAAHNRKAIILFKRPQEQSYLCQKAFDNSYMNSVNLVKLDMSKTLENIEGFAKNNLKGRIKNRIKELAPTK